MKVTFWLLDVNYEFRDNTPEIWLWGIDSSENRVLVVDRSFLAYFYAVVEDDADPAKVVERIEAVRAEYPLITKLEVVERKFFGKPVETVKVYCKDPNVASKCAKGLRRLEGVKDCLEDDIRHSMRYLVDNNVVPCGWHEMEVNEVVNTAGVQVD
jgi:DNA polymerase I